MALKRLVIVPIYWGSHWRPPSDPRERTLRFTWIDINAAMWSIMGNAWYLRGLEEYGIAPGSVHPGHILDEEPPKSPASFSIEQCWETIDKVVANGHVPAPESWDDDLSPLYTLFVEPGSYYSDPNIFGSNDAYRAGASRAWVTANSNLAGAVHTFAHEMVEGSSGRRQIADMPPCGEDVVLNGLTLPTYRSERLGACWPSRDAVFIAESIPKVAIEELASTRVHIAQLVSD
jgi:hypothetical protein